MKKFFLFYILLFFAATGWADEIQPSTSVDNPEHVYRAHGGKTNTTTYWGCIGAPRNSSLGALFAFISTGTENQYLIYCLSNKKYVSYDKTSIGNKKNFVISQEDESSANPWQITSFTGNNTTYYQLQPINSDNTVASYYMNWYTGLGSAHNSMGLWQQDGSADTGSSWTFESITIPESLDEISCTLSTYVSGETTPLMNSTSSVTGVTNSFLMIDDEKLPLPAGTKITNSAWENNGTSFRITYSYEFPLSSETTKNYTYIGISNSSNYLLYSSGDNIKETQGLQPTNLNDNTYKWAIIASPDNEGNMFFKIQNQNGKYINGTTAGNVAANYPTLADEGTEYAYGECVGGSNGFYVPKTSNFLSINSMSSADEQTMFIWTKGSGATHKGSNVSFFTPVDFESLKNQLTTNYNKAIKSSFPIVGTATGTYTTTKETDYQTRKTAYESVSLDEIKNVAEGTTGYTQSQFNTAIKAIDYEDVLKTCSLTLNQPTPGFYYIKNKATGAYVKGENVHNTETKMQTEKNKDAIFYINEDKNIMAYETGAYWRAVYYLGVGQVKGYNFEYKDYWTFEPSNTIGQYALKYGVSESSPHYATGNSTTATFWTDTPTEDNASWILEPVEELPLAIGSNGWATFSAPVAVTLPPDAKAYYVNSGKKENGNIDLQEINGAIPANQGVIIKSGDDAGNITLTITNGETASISDNKLVANIDANKLVGAAGDGKYVLATRTGDDNKKVTGFMKYNATNYTLGGHKCYLQLDGTSASAASFLPILIEDDLTGINGTETTTGNSDAAIYDLQGRKVNATQKGRIYIQNGKAFIAK